MTPADPRAARVYLECPCCGDEGAESDEDGCFTDGQPLMCGCVGHVSAAADDEDPWIHSGDDPCPCAVWRRLHG